MGKLETSWTFLLFPCENPIKGLVSAQRAQSENGISVYYNYFTKYTMIIIRRELELNCWQQFSEVERNILGFHTTINYFVPYLLVYIWWVVISHHASWEVLYIRFNWINIKMKKGFRFIHTHESDCSGKLKIRRRTLFVSRIYS
jgi:hypothetical protein